MMHVCTLNAKRDKILIGKLPADVAGHFVADQSSIVMNAHAGQFVPTNSSALNQARRSTSPTWSKCSGWCATCWPTMGRYG